MFKHIISAVAAVCATFAFMVPAGATEGPTQTADGSVCGEVTLSGTEGQYNGTYLLHWFVEADPANVGNISLPGSDTVTFDEDYLGGEISVVYYVTGPEANEVPAPEEVTIDTDCDDGPTSTTSTTSTTAPPSTPTTAPPGDILNCDDVSSVVQVSDGDPNNLDADGDGVACEEATPVAPAATPVVATPQFTG